MNEGIIDIPSMFKVDTIGWAIPELAEGCEWVKDQMDTLLCIKLDGVPCQVWVDPVTNTKKISREMGLGWVNVDITNPHPMDTLVRDAYLKASKGLTLPAGLYVAYGPGIMDNRMGVSELDMVRIAPPDARLLVDWRMTQIERGAEVNVKDFYDSIADELEESTVEGLIVVWEKPSMVPYKMAQVTRKEFGMEWPIPTPLKDLMEADDADPFKGLDISSFQ